MKNETEKFTKKIKELRRKSRQAVESNELLASQLEEMNIMNALLMRQRDYLMELSEKHLSNCTSCSGKGVLKVDEETQEICAKCFGTGKGRRSIITGANPIIDIQGRIQ